MGCSEQAEFVKHKLDGLPTDDELDFDVVPGGPCVGGYCINNKPPGIIRLLRSNDES